jgi:hypothetical protein
MKKVLIIVLAVILLISGSVYYLLFTSKSIGVKWTEQDYKSYLQKIGAVDSTTGESPQVTNGPSKPFPVNASFTNSEISAMVTKECEKTNSPVKDVQIKFLAGNELESTFVTSDKLIDMIPADKLGQFKIAGNLISNKHVYVKMKVEKASSKSIKLDIEDAKVGHLGIPNSAVQQASTEIEAAINTNFAKLNNFSIDEVNFSEGIASFKGNLQSIPRNLD